jgi:two-component system, NarL family, response regulator DevR
MGVGVQPESFRTPIRVFLVDDHEVVVEGVRSVIEGANDLTVVGQASTVADALTRIGATRPDVVVLDLHLPDGTGLDVCRSLRRDSAVARCLLLSAFADEAVTAEAESVGAYGCVQKSIRASELPDQIRRVAQGERVVDLGFVTTNPERRKLVEALATLTDAEARVLRLIAEGRSNREIARVLLIAEKTVKNRVSTVLRKLGVVTRTEAAVFYVRTNGPQGIARTVSGT